MIEMAAKEVLLPKKRLGHHSSEKTFSEDVV